MRDDVHFVYYMLGQVFQPARIFAEATPVNSSARIVAEIVAFAGMPENSRIMRLTRSMIANGRVFPSGSLLIYGESPPKIAVEVLAGEENDDA